ncbi:class I SAM-dependent methyltransferase [Komagataeibacter rhaeticus]|uniref:class I SAM-dependent methyltransferase n=1 Tax=Komagataeibacter rhaeticus TaxID=215221 RepID=UPI0039E745C2
MTSSHEDHNTVPAPSPQNIYDDPRFFEGYRTLREKDTGLNGALEIPAIRALLPDLRGRTVLDLGCGFGDFARHARAQGAARVTALDVSANMIEAARALTQDAAITYIHGSIEDCAMPPAAFDLAVSSLALHYIADYRAVVRRVFDCLRPGGTFIFSVEHPVQTAYPVGWVCDKDGNKLHWPLDRYQQEGARSTSWFVDGVIKYHRTMETYVNTLIACGFQIRHLAEPCPPAAILQARPDLEDTVRRPPMLILVATKPVEKE